MEVGLLIWTSWSWNFGSDDVKVGLTKSENQIMNSETIIGLGWTILTFKTWTNDGEWYQVTVKQR